MKSEIFNTEIAITLRAILELEEIGDIGAVKLAEDDLQFYRSKIEQFSHNSGKEKCC